MNSRLILSQLKKHAPFTALGTASGILLVALFTFGKVPRNVSETLFWGLHPLHVLLSAHVTAAMYRLNGRRNLFRTILIGYIGSIGIATLSDSLIPFAGEWLLNFPHRELRIGFIEKWWLVNPLAFAGIAMAWFLPRTRFPHAGHVFISTWASMFHMITAMNAIESPAVIAASGVFLFLSVWIPCCTSDIIFPLLWTVRLE